LALIPKSPQGEPTDPIEIAPVDRYKGVITTGQQREGSEPFHACAPAEVSKLQGIAEGVHAHAVEPEPPPGEGA
jgi:hypothetical protein